MDVCSRKIGVKSGLIGFMKYKSYLKVTLIYGTHCYNQTDNICTVFKILKPGYVIFLQDPLKPLGH